MKVRYGIINPPTAKEVDRTNGVCAAIVYLARLGKMTGEDVEKALDELKAQLE